MSNRKQEIAKIAREIKSIKAQLNKSAGVTWDEWYDLDSKEKRKLFDIFAKKVMGALPKNGKVEIRSVYNDLGSGPKDVPNSIYWMKDGKDDGANYIQIYPIPEDNFGGSIAFASDYRESTENFSGGSADVAKHFSDFANWTVGVLKSQVDKPGLFE